MAVEFLNGIAYVRYMWKGKRIKFSTNQSNRKVAELAEINDKAERVKGRVGIIEAEKLEEKIPTLRKFIDDRFDTHAKKEYKLKSYRDWIVPGLKALKAFPRIAEKKLNAITSEDVIAFRDFRAKAGLKANSVNAVLRVLSVILSTAEEWKVIAAHIKVHRYKMDGEGQRERVVSERDEKRYLFMGSGMLVAEVATLLVDTGLRPEEAYRLCWENISWETRQLSNHFGKTKAAKRTLPMTTRVREILEKRFVDAGEPTSGFVFPAPTKTGHITGSSLKKQHDKIFKLIAAQKGEKPVEYFVLYSLRHTFLTRLAAHTPAISMSTFMRIAGHKTPAMTLRYIHTDQRAVAAAMESLAQSRNADRLGN